MKTMKYRSVISSFCVMLLSVFLFTSCEKESDNGPDNSTQIDRLEKFKRLSFAKLDGSNSSGFTAPDGSMTFVKAGNNGSTFTQTSGTTSSFTDPSSTGYSFSISSSFGAGGGSATLDGEKYEMDFGFCASADFLGFLDSDSDTTGNDSDDGDVNVDIFVGISGDFDISSEEQDNAGLDLILYTFSYNDATKIGGFDDFGEDEIGDYAFVIAVAFGDDYEDGKFYFATEGSVNFSGSEVLLNGVKMAEVSFDDDDISDMLVNLQANLECVTFEE